MAKVLSEAQRAALARGRAKRAANAKAKASGSKASKPRKAKASGSKASKPRKAKASGSKARKAKPRAGDLKARVAALETRVENHGAVLSDLVGIVEQHGARLSAVESAFGLGSGSGRGARTVMMPAIN